MDDPVGILEWKRPVLVMELWVQLQMRADNVVEVIRA